jgi:hypothetical protein
MHLNSHPSILMYPEIFNLFAVSRTDLDKVLTDPLSYLNSFFEKRRLASKTAAGFKIFYNQANRIQLEADFHRALCLPEPGEAWKKRVAEVQSYVRCNYDAKKVVLGFERIWEKLKADASIKIIHLTRKNKLKQLLSFYRATLNDQWKSYERKSLSDRPVRLPYDTCLDFFNTYTLHEEQFKVDFSGHENLSITYEELKANKGRILVEIQHFLNVPLQEGLRSSLEKQRRQTLQEAIVNYNDLKNQFKNSKWENFFED